MELLDENDQFTAETEAILNEIFNRFDVDKDDCLSIDELQSFAVFTNGSKFTEATMEEIQTYFDMDGLKLTRKGFYEMYYMQTVGDSSETIRDFKKHGFTVK